MDSDRVVLSKFKRSWLAWRLFQLTVLIAIIALPLPMALIRGENSIGISSIALVFLICIFVAGWGWLIPTLLAIRNWAVHNGDALFLERDALVFIDRTHLAVPVGEIIRAEALPWSYRNKSGVNIRVVRTSGDPIDIGAYILNSDANSIIDRINHVT